MGGLPDAMEKPLLSGQLVAALTVGLTAVLLAARLGWVEPANPLIVPIGWGALPFAVLLALGLAVVIGLAVANWRRLRAVLRPNRGRVIGAVVLGFVTPVGVFSWLPWIVGGLWLVFGLPALTDFNLVGFFWMSGILGLAAVLWYPISCLIVSGIHSRVLRVAIFALMFWAGYGAIILLWGTLKFTL